MRRLRLIAALAAVAGALTLTGTAGATIIVQRGMAGVRLGWTKPDVRSTLGGPLRIVHGTNEFGAFTIFRYPHRVQVVFQGNVSVTSITTTGRHERTPSGIGVGSTEAALRAALPRAHCTTELGFRHCQLGRSEPGRRVTDFAIRNGKVVRVTVGFVID
jgi:hypothetical protein